VISRVNLPEQRREPARAEFFLRRDDWGEAPSLFRLTAMIACLALVVRAVATALPGSRSGIESMIRRTDVLSSVLSQVTVLLGGAQVVLLVVATLGERNLSYAYRITIVPTSAAVLMLVMLASTMGLDLEASLVVGLAALVLAGAAGATALQRPASRAQGMILLSITIASAVHLLSRLLALGLGQHQMFGPSRAPLLLAFARAADAIAMALLAVRLSAERGTAARIAVIGALVVATGIAWGALRGSLDGAALWQVIASRSLYELAGGAASLGATATRYGIESFAVLLGGTVIFWPGRLSTGAVSAALAVLARPSVDVPECALILTLAALSAPAATPFRASLSVPTPTAERSERDRG
jgi:hypothetical protein